MGILTSIDYSPDGKKLAVGSEAGEVAILDILSPTPIHRWKGHGQRVSSVDWSPDGNAILSTGGDGSCRQWDSETGKMICEAYGYSPAEYFPDGTRVMAVKGQECHVLNSADLREIVRMRGTGRSFALGPNGASIGFVRGEMEPFLHLCPYHQLTQSGTDELTDDLGGRIEEIKRQFWERVLKEGTFPLNPPENSPPITGITGQWDFESGNLSATIGRPMKYLDLKREGRTAAKTHFGSTDSFGISSIGGQSAHVLNFPSSASDEGYLMYSGSDGSGDGQREYTLLLDIYLPMESTGRFCSILNRFNRNEEPAALVISPTGGMGVARNLVGHFTRGEWHRIAFSVNASLESGSWLQTHMDGVNCGRVPLSLAEIRRLALDRGTRGNGCLLLSDRLGRTCEGFVNSIQFRNYAMTDAEVASIGTPTAAGLPIPEWYHFERGTKEHIPKFSKIDYKYVETKVLPELSGNRVIGQWDFSLGDLRSTYGYELAVFAEERSRKDGKYIDFGTTKDFGINFSGTLLESMLEIKGFSAGEGLLMVPGLPPISESRRANAYTLFVDLYVPSTVKGRSIPLLNTSTLLGDPADFSISENLGVVAGTEELFTVLPDKWHRLGFVVNPHPPTDLTVKVFLDGIQTGFLHVKEGLNGRFSLPSILSEDPGILLFSGPEGCPGPVYVDVIQLRSYPLSDGEMDTTFRHAGHDPIPLYGDVPPLRRRSWSGPTSKPQSPLVKERGYNSPVFVGDHSLLPSELDANLRKNLQDESTNAEGIE